MNAETLIAYGLIGSLIAVCVITFSYRIHKNQSSRKNAKQSNFNATIILFYLVFCIVLWPVAFPLFFNDLRLRKNGVAYGMGGGGYIYEKRTWLQYLSDEWQGREGEPSEMH